MFWTERRRQKLQKQAVEYEGVHFNRFLLSVLTEKRLTVALARMEIEERIGFMPVLSGGPPPDTVRREKGRCRFFGVVHEVSGWGNYRHEWFEPFQKWIRATVEVVTSAEPRSACFGYALLGADASEKNLPVLNRQLYLEVVLHNKEHALLPALQDALRDAAISGNQ